MTLPRVARPAAVELTDSGSLTRVLLDCMTEGVSLSREDGTIVYTNPAEDRLFGYGPGELVGRHVSVQNAYPPEENARVVAGVMAELKRAGAWSGTWRNRRRDGTEFTTRSRISAVEIGGERHWLCVQEDITQEAAAARALEEERARLALATEAGSVGVWDWDLQRNRMTYSDRAKAICGFPLDRPVTFEDARRIVHPDDHPRTFAQSRRALDPAIQDREPFEYRIIRPDGSLRWVLAHGQAIFEKVDGRPQPVRYLGTLQDITARHDLEEAERRAAQRLRLAIEAGRMAVWDVDLVSDTLVDSPQLRRLFGFPEDEPLDIGAVRACYHPGERERLGAELRQALARGATSFESDLRFVRPDGAHRWFVLRCDVVCAEDGSPLRAIGVLFDETDRQQAETQLRASEAELRLLTDALPILVSFIDKDERYRLVNGAYEAWFGRPREEILGRTIGEVLGEEAYKLRRTQIEAALQGEPSHFEAFTPGSDGARRETELQYLPRRDADGAVDGFYVVVTDVTDQKAARRALLEAREAAEREATRTATILGQLAEGVIVADTAGRITFVNDAAARIHGVAQLDVTPEHYAGAYHLFTEDGRPYPSENLPLTRAALHGETVEDAHWLIRHADGREVIAVGGARPIRTPDGTRIGAVLTLRDDTARTKAEAQLRRLNQDLEAEVAQRTAERDRIWRNSSELMAVLGFDGHRRSVNPAWTRVLGYDEETLLSMSLTDVTHPEDRPRLARAIDRLRRGERIAGFEHRLRHIDGSYRIISWTGVPGQSLFDVIGRDVTEQRQAEEALRQSQKMEALGQLTGGIAHDFNNLLQAVQGSLALIAKRPDQAERVRLLAEQGLDAARRGGSLTAQLLAFSRAEQLEIRPVAVERALGRMRDLLQRSLGPMVEVALRPSGLDLAAHVDSTQLEMAVLNLGINARDAMPSGGDITIRVEVRTIASDPELAAGEYVVIHVTDTGTGMTSEVAQRAFEPFFTTKGLGKGTGLGLSQVYAMARQSGGTARLDTQPGQGTTVCIFLRRAEAPADEDGAAWPTPARGLASRGGATILVVDDDDDVRRWLATALGTLGHSVVEAASGPEGLARLGQAPDLLIVDFAMPGMTGAEVIQAARRSRPDLPVVLVTGFAEAGAVSDIADANLSVLRKPFDLDQLEAILDARLPPAGAGPGPVPTA